MADLLPGRDRFKGVGVVDAFSAQTVPGAIGLDGEEGGKDLRHGAGHPDDAAESQCAHKQGERGECKLAVAVAVALLFH